MATELKPGDIFLTKGHSFISWAIRVCTRVIGEKKTQVNHVGLVVGEGDLKSAVVVEALSKVVEHTLWGNYGPPKKDLVAIYRANNLTPEDVEVIVKTAKRQVGKKYGYLMIVMHFLDWLLFGVYFFRRLIPGSKYPICSWVVAYSYSKADKHFGKAAGAAEPDDIWDFIQKHRDIYDEIHPLEQLT